MSAEPSESSKVLYPRPSAPRVDWFGIWAVGFIVWSIWSMTLWEKPVVAFYLALLAIFVAILRGQRK